MSKVRTYIAIIGIIIAIVFIVIKIIISGKNEKTLLDLASKKQRLKDIKENNKAKIDDIDKQQKELNNKITDIRSDIKKENIKLEELKKEEECIKNHQIEKVVTPSQPDDILNTLKEINK